MRKVLITALTLAMALPTVALAQSGSMDANGARMKLEVGTELGTSADQITAALADLGFRASDIKEQDGHFRVDVTNEGAQGEIYIDATTGRISSQTLD